MSEKPKDAQKLPLLGELANAVSLRGRSPLSCKSAGMCYNKNHLFHTIYVGIWAATR